MEQYIWTLYAEQPLSQLKTPIATCHPVSIWVCPWCGKPWPLVTIYHKVPFLTGSDSQVLDLPFEETQNKWALSTVWAVNLLVHPLAFTHWRWSFPTLALGSQCWASWPHSTLSLGTCSSEAFESVPGALRIWRAELNKHSRCSPIRREINRSTFVIIPLPLLTSTTRNLSN